LVSAKSSRAALDCTAEAAVPTWFMPRRTNIVVAVMNGARFHNFAAEGE